MDERYKNKDLREIQIYRIDRIEEHDFSNSNMENGNFTGTTFYKCKFDNTNLEGVATQSTKFIECQFNDTKMDFMVFGENQIVRSNLKPMNAKVIKLKSDLAGNAYYIKPNGLGKELSNKTIDSNIF